VRETSPESYNPEGWNEGEMRQGKLFSKKSKEGATNFAGRASQLVSRKKIEKVTKPILVFGCRALFRRLRDKVRWDVSASFSEMAIARVEACS